MGSLVKYWTFYQLNAQGRVINEEIPQAKSFIQQEYPDRGNQNTSSDAGIQRHLFGLFRNQDAIAEICLRCIISEQIKQICVKLECDFGKNHQFNRYDLLPYVLNDSLNSRKQTQTQSSTATRILQDFDPEKASLSTWTTRLVRYEPNLTQFLLERGVYLITDWAILNDTNPQQLHRILKEFHHLNDEMINPAISLLKAYHAIYRQERLAGRKVGSRSKCVSPTSEQLRKIAQVMGLSLTPEEILTQLQDLAAQIRERRVSVKTKKFGEDSLSDTDIQSQVEKQQLVELFDDSEKEVVEFLHRYDQQFLNCLEKAIASVVTQWLNKQKPPKKQQFFEALKLFHCQGLSMSAIASVIGLQQQFQVSRLMQLKNFRSDIQQRMLQELRKQVIELATIYREPEKLIQQEEQINIALSEQIYAVFKSAETEASMAKDQPFKSIFSQYLCLYLDS